MIAFLIEVVKALVEITHLLRCHRGLKRTR